MLGTEIAKIILKAVDDHYWDTCDKDIVTKHIIEGVLPVVINQVDALPSDYADMTIGDVLEAFPKLIAALTLVVDNIDPHMGSCPMGRSDMLNAVTSALTHNGQPIRRRT